jgi:hypothetical protein
VQFTVLPVRARPDSPQPGQAFLVRDNCDDCDHHDRTTFLAVVGGFAAHQPSRPTRTGTPRPTPARRLRPGLRTRQRGSGRYRLLLSYDRAVLAGAVVREKLHTATAVRGRAYDAVAHQQAAMPSNCSGPGRRPRSRA